MSDPAYLLQRPRTRLLFASATALFLELACIRWAGSHVVYLAYVANLLLITAFLGLGLGTWLGASLQARTLARWLSLGPLVLLAFVACVAFAGFAVRIDGAEVVYFGNALLEHPLPAWAVLPLLGCLLAACFGSLGSAIGCELKAIASPASGPAKPLTAYSLDVAGSLLGIALFAAASFFGVPAQLWFAAVWVGWLLLLPASRAVVFTCALAGVLTIGIVQWTDWGSLWSPYQRVSIEARGPTTARAPGDPAAGSPGFRLSVNNIVHQFVSDVRHREPFYEFPYRAAGATLPGGASMYLTGQPPHADWTHDPFAVRRDAWGGRVAIIGAGNGTDVAAALAYGAGHIDAVELDPTLAAIGARLQPNRPFADARVQLHVMDGRTFLERTQTRHDVIVFALPDSLTLASPYASLRLESFLFTEESFASALRNLDPQHGLLVIYNYYRKPWLVDRIANTLAHAAGYEPLVLLRHDRMFSAVFIAGPGLAHVDRNIGLAWGYRAPERARADVGTATDDWPFLYLRERAIPSQIVFALALLLALSLAAVALTRRFALVDRGNVAVSPPRRQSRQGPTPSRGSLRSRDSLPGTAPTLPGTAPTLAALSPFFFMGVAFLLLETSGLVRMALLFGSTWFVNALVFASVLVMVLIANAIAGRFALRQTGALFMLLLAALAIAFGVRTAALVGMPALPKYLIATCLLFVPILLANLAFSRAFRDCAWPASAFGANLFGAVVGGALENIALVTGYRALLLLAGALYTAAWLAMPSTRSDAVRMWRSWLRRKRYT